MPSHIRRGQLDFFNACVCLPFSCKLNKILFSFCPKNCVFDTKKWFKNQRIFHSFLTICDLVEHLSLSICLLKLLRFRWKWPETQPRFFFWVFNFSDPNVHWIDLEAWQVVCSSALANNLVTYQNKFWRSLQRSISKIFKNFQGARK